MKALADCCVPGSHGLGFEATFHVNGVPKGQPRPRAFARRVGDKVVARVFDAGTAEEWKSRIVAAGRPKRPEQPIDGPVFVSIAFYLPRPKRLMRKCDPDGAVLCESKPDIDNLSKAVLDALGQDGWWRDDAQVAGLIAHKFYHTKIDRPGATVMVWTRQSP